MQRTILCMPFPGGRKGKKRSLYIYTRVGVLTAAENFAVLLENTPQLRH